MGERQCFVCKKMVRAGDENEHLRTNHLGPHYFWLDAREYRTEEPSMTVAEIIKMGNGNFQYQFVQEREDGEWVYFTHSQAVDLTQRPHFFLVPAATMWALP